MNNSIAGVFRRGRGAYWARWPRSAVRYAAVSALVLGAAASTQAQPFSVDWFTFGGGSGATADGQYVVSGSPGQPAVGLMSDGYFSVQGGFWSGVGAAPWPPPGPPANDNFASAQVLTGASGDVTGSNVGATKEPGEPDHAGIPGGHSVWYRWTPPASGQYFFDADGTSFPGLLAVYSGSSVDQLTVITAVSNNWLHATAWFVAGASYSIALDGAGGATGSLALHWGQDTSRTVITFDDLPPSTVVSNQYASRGVTFSGPSGAPWLDQTVLAHSGSEVASLLGFEGGAPSSYTEATFTDYKEHVQVYAGLLDEPDGASATVTLKAYDLGHALVGQSSATVTAGQAINTLLQVDTGRRNIASCEVAAGQEPVCIDDLSFEAWAPGQPPDFALAGPPTINVFAGQSVTNLITIRRIDGSSGGVDLSVTGLPPGVSASLSPNPADTAAALIVSADASAPPTGSQPAPLTITAQPLSPSAGNGPRTVAVALSVHGWFTLANAGFAHAQLPPFGTASIPIVVTRDPLFTGGVTLGVKGLPNGVEASFNPPVVEFDGGPLTNSTTLTLHARGIGALLGTTVLIEIDGSSPGAPGATASAQADIVRGYITSFSPTEGWAPMALQPGTSVVIQGNGFLLSSRVDFGEDGLGTVPDSINSDGTELRVRVPRNATDGPIHIETQDSVISSSPMSFRVHSFRNTDGFAFCNNAAFQDRVGGYTVQDVEELFGYAQTHLRGRYSPFAYLFAATASRFLWGGQCFGFSLASQRLLQGDEPYSAFPSDGPAGTTNNWVLTGPDPVGDPSGATTTGASDALAHYVHIQHLAQVSAECMAFRLKVFTANLACTNHSVCNQSLSNSIASQLLSRRYPVILIWPPGHAEVAYDLEPAEERDPAGDFYIRLYNPNEPFLESENDPFGGHWMREEDSRIRISKLGEWNIIDDLTDPTYLGLQIRHHVVLPYSIVPVHPTLPCWRSGYGLMSLMGDSAGINQFADTRGHTLFLSDGSINPDPATRLAEAAPFAPMAGYSTAQGLIYAGSNTCIQTIQGTTNGTYWHATFGPGFVTRLLDVPTTTNDTDTITTVPGVAGLGFQTSVSNKPVVIQVLASAADGSVRGATVATTALVGGGDKVTFDETQQTFVYAHDGPPTQFTITLTQPDTNGNPQVLESPPLSISGAESVQFDPADWSRLNATQLRLTFTDTSTGRSWEQIPRGSIPLPCVEILPGNVFSAGLPGNTGATYDIQTSTDLAHWQSFKTIDCDRGAVRFQDTIAAGAAQRFYRAVEK